MFFDDHKKRMTTIMARRHPSGEVMSSPMKPEIVKDEEGNMDGKHLAAEDILAAHHSKSASHLKDAMSNFIDMHMADKHRGN